MDESYNSNNTSIYELKSETLDHLYKNQVADLRDLLLKKAAAPDLELCSKWLKVFNRTTNTEKVARNCLCTLMQQQIKEFGCLAEPFTDLNNCNRGLETVLHELDEQSLLSFVSYRTDSAVTYKSHTCLTREDSCCVRKYARILKASKYHDYNSELLRLQNEFESLRLQLDDKLTENAELKKISEKYQREKETNEEFIKKARTNILNSIRDKLLYLDNYGIDLKQMKLLESIFHVYSNDSAFMESVRKYDLDLQHMLSSHFECELKKYKNLMARDMSRKFLKKKSKLRYKYERRLQKQIITQRLQLKLAKLKCFSELRHIFIRSYSNFEKIDLWNILNIIEEKYQRLASGL